MLYITLRQYEYVVAVAEWGGLSQAAAALNVSQPSLSVALTRVEDRLGQPLFRRRKGTAIEITPYGHRVIRHARKLLDMATDLETGQSATAMLSLGCFVDIAPWYLAPAIQSLSDAFPERRISGREGRFADLARDLREGRIDIAITYDIGFEKSLMSRPIRSVQPTAFMEPGHPLADRAQLDIADLADCPIILFGEDQSESFVRDLFRRFQVQPHVVQRAQSLEVMRSLAASGLGIGISYSRPPGDVSYDRRPVISRPITTPGTGADIVLLWSALRPRDPGFDRALESLASLMPRLMDQASPISAGSNG